jgi:hypothetical protein
MNCPLAIGSSRRTAQKTLPPKLNERATAKRAHLLGVRLVPRAPRHQPFESRSKIFEKSEKMSCNASAGSLFLTAKPNPTNGETND